MSGIANFTIERIKEALPAPDAELTSTQECYRDMALRGAIQSAIADFNPCGRFPDHDAFIFGLHVASFGFEQAIAEHQVECTEDFEKILNAPNEKMGRLEAEERASNMTKEAHFAELKANPEWKRYDINYQWKLKREAIAEELMQGPSKKLVRNCAEAPTETASDEFRAELAEVLSIAKELGISPSAGIENLNRRWAKHSEITIAYDELEDAEDAAAG